MAHVNYTSFICLSEYASNGDLEAHVAFGKECFQSMIHLSAVCADISLVHVDDGLDVVMRRYCCEVGVSVKKYRCVLRD